MVECPVVVVAGGVASGEKGWLPANERKVREGVAAGECGYYVDLGPIIRPIWLRNVVLPK